MSGSRGVQRSPSTAQRALLLGVVGALGLGLGLAGAGLVRGGHDATADSAVPLMVETAAVSASLAPAAAPPPPASAPFPGEPDLGAGGLHATRGVIERGGSLAGAMRSRGISPATVDTIARELRGVFDFRHAQPGDAWHLVRDTDADLVEFRYSTADLASFHLWRDGEAWMAERREPEFERTVARVAGVVTTSLYDTILQLGEKGQLASDFADLFAWDVDFSRMVQSGDQFSILYERLYRLAPDGRREYVGPGMILAGRYLGQTGEHSAVYFEKGEERGGYYREDGSSVERQFLVAPLKYSRVSSRFSHRRRHPILKVTRPHHGIDYAAPHGTPLFAVADGKVVFRGRAGGFGNLVKIRHANGYISYYAHMASFAKNLVVGDAVHQKQVVGYVGSTGLATGPHVCFRIAKDGRFVNPARVKTPAGDPVPTDRMPEFELIRDALLSQLDGGARVVTDEAL